MAASMKATSFQSSLHGLAAAMPCVPVLQKIQYADSLRIEDDESLTVGKLTPSGPLLHSRAVLNAPVQYQHEGKRREPA